MKTFNSKLKKQLDTLQNLLASVYNQLEQLQGTLGRGGGGLRPQDPLLLLLRDWSWAPLSVDIPRGLCGSFPLDGDKAGPLSELTF